MQVMGFLAALGGGFFVGNLALSSRSAPPVAEDGGARLRVDLRGDEPSVGATDALVTIVEFSDFQCPYCAKAAGPVLDAVNDHADDVRLVFKHYPLPGHAKAVPAARAAWAAHQQGKFWEAHDWLYEHKADVEGVRSYLQLELGLDGERFGRDSVSEAAGNAIDEDMLAGGKVGITGTPAFLVNGKLYSGTKTRDQWASIIRTELAAARALVDSGVPRAEVYATLMKDAVATRGDGAPVGGKKPSARANARRPGEPDPAVTYRVTPDGRPTLGPENAPIAVVVFSDFQCPFCVRLAPRLRSFIERHPDVKVVMRNLPLQSIHPQARAAAKAALAAGRQGKYWEMHDLLFERGVGGGNFTALAAELGLDATKFAADLADPALDASIDEDLAVAKQYGVSSTPATFINGRFVAGAVPDAVFDQVISDARAEVERVVAGGTAKEQAFAAIMEAAKTAVEG
jgi:protein-disulfide isomerase